jgi:GrpB-like predicted nucleotidyltransferase (UPF0157 family)
VLRIEHVGSTAVPGLAAKPIVDMVLAVADSADEAAYSRRSRRRDTRCASVSRTGTSTACSRRPRSTAICTSSSSGCSEIARMLVFRDRLRAHDADRILYEETKRALAARTWRHVACG